MDVKHSARFVLSSGCLLATLFGVPAWADDASSMVVVAASDGDDDRPSHRIS
jgi:hypothetical protein